MSKLTNYYGTKNIEAHPMNRADYNKFRGWELPADEDGSDEGYLVVYPEQKSNTDTYIGYVSWSPKEVFEQAYKSSGEMNFGHAIEAAKAGKKIARAGWNGKGMYIIFVAGTPKAKLREGTPYSVATGLEECEILPHFDMWTVNSEGRRAMLCGWLASQSDMLADDWAIVD